MRLPAAGSEWKGNWELGLFKASPFHLLSRQCIKLSLRVKPNTAECSPGVPSATAAQRVSTWAASQPRKSRVSEPDALILPAAPSGLRAELQPKRDKG